MTNPHNRLQSSEFPSCASMRFTCVVQREMSLNGWISMSFIHPAGLMAIVLFVFHHLTFILTPQHFSWSFVYERIL